jgi:hypothetical protein
MKVYTTKISHYIRKKCADFANESEESSRNHWAKREVTKKAKRLEDIYTGKMGEWGAYAYLKELGLEVNKPDLIIYDGRRKSWDADLVDADGRCFHCKTQSEASANAYGTSWILQYDGKGYGHTDKLFKNQSKYDYIVPMKLIGRTVHIYGIIKISELFEADMIKEPKVEWFKKTKRAVYWDDIKTLTTRQRWRVK